ncbi:hypothetical protein L1887_31535 [Cichorium endivia]|nr:hypothetical protein L1887_31535 [Cichorium endivia]
MVHFQIYPWLLLILIIAYHAIPLAEGRQLKSLKKQQVDSKGKKVSEKTARFPPQVPNQTQKDEISDLKAVTAFRPTTPGSSPGAGHSFTENRPGFVSKAVSNVSGVFHSTSESDTGFRPTKPGSSPGAGHSIHDKFGVPKV